MKIKTIISLTFLLIVSIIVTNQITSKKYMKYDNNTYIAVSVDGEQQNNIPTKANYAVNVSCMNATGSWDYDNWKAIITNITDTAKCSIVFTSITPLNLNNYIMSLTGTSQGTGQLVNENGYRYEGKNPNNYIIFNKELWRIIGVFDSDTHGMENQNLVKIIRAESIGGLTRDKNGTRDWATSSLKTLLNDYYYNGINESTLTYCYGYGATMSGNCDFTRNGITNAVYRNMIENVTWKTGGYTTPSRTAPSFYTLERTENVGTGYIGLLYPSDYGYTVLASSCARTINLNSYGTSMCASQSWLAGQSYEWLLARSTSSSNIAFHTNVNGALGTGDVDNGYGVRPVLYLKSDVKKLAGDGSLSNPYIVVQ